MEILEFLESLQGCGGKRKRSVKKLNPKSSVKAKVENVADNSFKESSSGEESDCFFDELEQNNGNLSGYSIVQKLPINIFTRIFRLSEYGDSLDLEGNDCNVRENASHITSAEVVLKQHGYTCAAIKPSPWIGKGAFGFVVKAIDLAANGVIVAAKMINMTQSRTLGVYVRKETELWQKLSHPNIVKMITSFTETETMVMVMEYVDGEDMFDRISRRGPVEEAQARIWFKQLSTAIFYLHDSQNIVHRDIKLENILVDTSKGLVKLCDFGLAKLDLDQKLSQEFCGSTEYQPPEMLHRLEHSSRKSDVWALGEVYVCA